MNQNLEPHLSSQSELMFRVIRTIDENALLKANDKVLIAVSGGADSMVLFDLFLKFQARYGLTLGVAHLDHGLRAEESKKDRAFVEHVAENAGVPCYSLYRDVKAFQTHHRLSLEDAARKLRYTFLFETAEKHDYSKVATAHHGDDNAELVMINLMRGSGPSGLGGMAAMNRKGRLIRPFIDLSRSDIMAYVQENNVAYREDSSNSDRAILRNRIRHELLPLIDSAYQNEISRTLNRTARIIRDDEDWLNGVVEPFFKKALIKENDTSVRLHIPMVNGLHVALQRRLIRKAIHHVKGDLKRIGFHHVDEALRLMRKGPGRYSLDLPALTRILKDGDYLEILKEERCLREIPPFHAKDGGPDFEYHVEKPSEPYEMAVPEAGLRFRFSPITGPLICDVGRNDPETAHIAMNRLHFPLIIRNTQAGDRFRPLGMGGHQRVSRFFIHKKIPSEFRKTIPVLVSNNEIVWVCGHRIDDSVKILPETEKILKIELFLA